MALAGPTYDISRQVCRMPDEVTRSEMESSSIAESVDQFVGIPLTANFWDVLYTGFGSSQFDNKSITLEPQAALRSDETHAALVLERNSELFPFKDFILEVRASTEKQLRTPTANAWESLWIFFNYQENSPYKETNYFTLKPNGAELGLAYGEIEQDFLFTSDTPTLEIGAVHTYRIEKWGNHLAISVDGKSLPLPQEIGLKIFNHPGAIGFYTEDARVRIDSVLLEVLDPSASISFQPLQ